MGNINLLQSGYTGKVGQTYGVKQYKKYIAKAIPFSHTPHNKKQKNSLDAFIKLNRMSAKIAKHFFPYLNLSDKKMYKSNAVANFLKGLVSNNEFHINKLNDCVPVATDLEIASFFFDPDTLDIDLSINNNADITDPFNQKLLLFFLTNTGEVKAIKSGYGRSLSLNTKINYINFYNYYLVAFKSTKINKKWKISAIQVRGPIPLIIINGIFFTTRYLWHYRYYINLSVLYLPPQQANIENEILYLT